MPILHIRFTDEMDTQLEHDAKQQGLNKSAFIRQLYVMYQQYQLEKEIELSAKKPTKKRVKK